MIEGGEVWRAGVRRKAATLSWLLGTAAALACAAASCGGTAPVVAESEPSPPPPRAAPVASSAPSSTADDVCINNPPPPHPFEGLLGKARCDQEMFLTMAGIATQLGVECNHCHAPNPSDPKKEDYPKPTPKKQIANWMSMHLMQAIKPADGSPLKCKSCHVDPATGKPVAKILGNPRDPARAHEWMSLVMVNKFVTAKGEKLRCKSCHVDNFAKPGFQAKVILRSEQIPPH